MQIRQGEKIFYLKKNREYVGLNNQSSNFFEGIKQRY